MSNCNCDVLVDLPKDVKDGTYEEFAGENIKM